MNEEQIKGRRLTDAESMGMLFDDPYDYDEVIRDIIKEPKPAKKGCDANEEHIW